MQGGLDIDIAQENWEGAAVVASNLSELYLTMGDVRKALEFAQQCVELADRGWNEFDQMDHRTILADTLHQAGRLAEAEALFREAEAMQKQSQPEHPHLYSLPGFRHCGLLLDQGKYREVQDCTSQTLEWVEQAAQDILSIALDHLSLGRAHLFEAHEDGTGDFIQAAEHLDQAVNGLRQAGTQHHIPRGLLARVALHRVRGDFKRARRDLDEAKSIAERGGMGLFQADAHLEYARLYLAMGEAPEARVHLATAKERIGRMGYHRRDGEVAELEGRFEAG